MEEPAARERSTIGSDSYVGAQVAGYKRQPAAVRLRHSRHICRCNVRTYAAQLATLGNDAVMPASSERGIAGTCLAQVGAGDLLQRAMHVQVAGSGADAGA